jgi:glycosyltransferase involved in cell wall biosynthesis
MPLSERTRISVALCTYNGERFLHQQLDSIARQTRLPDELVVCDDRSTDRTLAIVREFAASAPYPVRVFENQANLGFAANFEGAIRRCDGDLIALSDQDDVWYPTRLERSEQEFIAHPRAGLVFSDADLIDEQDGLLGQTIWQRLGFVGERKQALLAGRFVVLAKHRFVTGATVMFRADLRDRVLPIPAGWVHDEWITLITAAFYDLRPIDQPLIRYRIHGSQQVGFVNKLEQRAQGNTRSERHWQRVEESAKELQQMCDALSAMALDQEREVLPVYQQHLQFLRFRSNLPAPRLARLGRVLTHFAQYGVHASGLASGLKDVALKKST